MRVINTDNYNGDYPNEKFIGEIMTMDQATNLADRLNQEAGLHASRWFMVVEDNYELQPGFEP